MLTFSNLCLKIAHKKFDFRVFYIANIIFNYKNSYQNGNSLKIKKKTQENILYIVQFLLTRILKIHLNPSLKKYDLKNNYEQKMTTLLGTS